jgi:hypothetical protein
MSWAGVKGHKHAVPYDEKLTEDFNQRVGDPEAFAEGKALVEARTNTAKAKEAAARVRDRG